MGIIDELVFGQSIGPAGPKVLLSCADFTPRRATEGEETDITVTARLENTTGETVALRWAITVDGARVSPWQRVDVAPGDVVMPEQTATTTFSADRGGAIGVKQRFGFGQTDLCGTMSVEEPPFDANLVEVVNCTFTPESIESITETVTYAGCIKNNNAETGARAAIGFQLSVSGEVPPVLARTERVTIPPGEIFCPPEVSRRLDNPIADANNVIERVVAEGGSFDVVTGDPLNIERT